jgi:microsomal dipeptidase-like Zn-dependent dipeptidase
VSVDLAGAADLHCHFGPDPHRARSVDAFEAAHEAAAAGHRAIVLKSHDSPTASLAWAVQRDVGSTISVFGGICCDREIGGTNPAAIEVALRLGARIVWLPTLSSAQDVANGVAAQLGIPGPGIRVTDADDRLTPETNEILDLVAEHDAVLATGHVSAAEHLAVTRAFAGRGKVVVTHAMEELAGPNLDAAQCAELAALGAHIELCALTCIGALATRPVDDLVGCIRRVGVDRVTLGTDFGQGVNEPPAAGLQTYADALFAAGLTEAEIRRMACTNPNALLARDG